MTVCSFNYLVDQKNFGIKTSFTDLATRFETLIQNIFEIFFQLHLITRIHILRFSHKISLFWGVFFLMNFYLIHFYYLPLNVILKYKKKII